jgi:2-succinyl-5-enolpyruvyl-6-hydroxy-3-cyclohexene-1-carboxylate synthase
VVIDNQGGRIFEQLPVAAQAGALFEAHWLTPPACDMRAAAVLFGHAYERAEHPEALAGALARALRPGAGCTIVHVPVEPRSATEDRRRIVATMEEQS